MLQARADAHPLVQWPGGVVRRHGGLLHALVEATPTQTVSAPHSSAMRWSWLREPRLRLADGSWLELRADPRGALRRSTLPATVRVAYRRADGAVDGRPGGRRLKRLLQAARLPPWQRGTVPLIYAGRRLLAVGEFWCAAAGAAGAPARDARRYRLRWHNRGVALI
jgi:tRNA(Ile)-lysidine synthase